MWNQENNIGSCYPIKYLDFYGIADVNQIPAWSADEITYFKDRTAQRTDSRNPKFLIPVIVGQLPNYHSKCNSIGDTATLDRLTELYALLSNISPETLLKEDKDLQVDLICDHFYQLNEQDSLIADMLFTTDDGPFLGENLLLDLPITEPTHTINLKSGTLLIYEKNDQVIIEHLRPDNEINWRKILTTYEDQQYLSDLYVPERPLSVSSLATKVDIYLDSEKLSLYIRNNGEFMFYFYSW